MSMRVAVCAHELSYSLGRLVEIRRACARTLLLHADDASTVSPATHCSDAILCGSSAMRSADEIKLVNAFTHAPHVMGARFFVSAFCDRNVAGFPSVFPSSASENRCRRLPASVLCTKRGRYLMSINYLFRLSM